MISLNNNVLRFKNNFLKSYTLACRSFFCWLLLCLASWYLGMSLSKIFVLICDKTTHWFLKASVFLKGKNRKCVISYWIEPTCYEESSLSCLWITHRTCIFLLLSALANPSPESICHGRCEWLLFKSVAVLFRICVNMDWKLSNRAKQIKCLLQDTAISWPNLLVVRYTKIWNMSWQWKGSPGSLPQQAKEVLIHQLLCRFPTVLSLLGQGRGWGLAMPL